MKFSLRSVIIAVLFFFSLSFISGCDSTSDELSGTPEGETSDGISGSGTLEGTTGQGVLGTLERETDQGTIVGQLYSHNGHECQRYLGIPYAKAPVGDLRFTPPQDPVPFEDGKLEAFEYGSMCSQLVLGYVSGNEDCLFLNVWTPSDAEPGDRYPVMFFIHGGSNNLGSGNQALGDFLGMAEEAVGLKSLNGFFDTLRKLTSLDEPIYQGNYLADKYKIVLVTINYRLGPLGHLAHPGLGDGSGNFAFLDMLKALEWVNRSIDGFGGDSDNVTVFGESSGAWDTCALMNMPAAKGLFHKAIMESQSCLSKTIEQAEKFSNKYVKNCECDEAADTAACLRNAKVSKLMAAATATFIPAVDGKVFPKHFAEAITTDQFNHVPVIIGNNLTELGVQLASDIGFNCPLDANLAIFAKNLRAPVYQYRFVHAPLSVLIPAIHMFELPYVFGATRDIFGGSIKRETAVESIVSSYWTSFAYTGDPNGGGRTYWPRYDRENQRYLKLKASPEEGNGSIITNKYNMTLSRSLVPAIMGAQIVFW